MRRKRSKLYEGGPAKGIIETLAARIAALEREVVELRARPLPAPQVIYVYPPPPVPAHQPWQEWPNPARPWITWGGDTSGTGVFTPPPVFTTAGPHLFTVEKQPS